MDHPRRSPYPPQARPVMSSRRPLAVGRRSGDKDDPIQGYQVVTIDGDRVGSVAAVSDGLIAVRCGNWPFQRLRALAAGLAVIRDVDHTVLILTSPEDLPDFSAPNHQGVSPPEPPAVGRRRARIRRA